MRRLYTLLLYLLMPAVLLYLYIRGFRESGYRARWSERFGRFSPPAQHGGIWVHAVSVGEVNAAAGLIRNLAERYPGAPLVVTTFTPTGSARVRELFGDAVFHVYSPFDLPGAVRRFLASVRPRAAIILETEIWPNLYRQCEDEGIPMLIANARISDRSFDRYRRLSGLTSEALARVDCIAAQSDRDAERLRAIGAPFDRVLTTGNIKFDLELPAGIEQAGRTIRRSWGDHRPVLVAGSTHPGEEDVVLEAFNTVIEDFPEALLVLVPRHPDRFDSAVRSAVEAGFRTSRLSETPDCPEDSQCYVIDAMGVLLNYYAAADVAFVGGSLVPVGGHNVLEPAAIGCPVITGPHTFNFEDIMDKLIEGGGAVRVQDAAELGDEIRRLFTDESARHAMSRRGGKLVEEGQGAVERTLALIEPLLSEGAD